MTDREDKLKGSHMWTQGMSSPISFTCSCKASNGPKKTSEKSNCSNKDCSCLPHSLHQPGLVMPKHRPPSPLPREMLIWGDVIRSAHAWRCTHTHTCITKSMRWKEWKREQTGIKIDINSSEGERIERKEMKSHKEKWSIWGSLWSCLGRGWLARPLGAVNREGNWAGDMCSQHKTKSRRDKWTSYLPREVDIRAQVGHWIK